MSLETKPHLEEISSLYKKICTFESEVRLKYSYSPVEKARHYIREDIDTVIDALSGELDLSPEEPGVIKEAMHLGKIDFTCLKTDGDTMKQDEFQLLYIMSRPFFKAMKHSMNMDNIFWQDGRCPVCGAAPSLSVLEKESQRKYICSYCGSRGNYMRIGCPDCLTENPQDITIITIEGEEGLRADTCGKCKSYYKTFDGPMLAEHSLDELDIMSIPLDIIVQEQGFHRRSPNPAGLIKMV